MAQRACCTLPFSYVHGIYLAGFFVTALLSWVLRDYGKASLDYSPLNKCLPADASAATVNDSCLGDLAVLRISFGNVVFFACLAVLLLFVTTQDNRRMVLHTGLWPAKFLAWGALLGTPFLMPNGMFQVYGEVARALSCIYIIFQLIILLDFIYIVNEWLLERESCRCVMVGSTVLLIAGSFVGMGFLYKHYAPAASCSLNIFFITWNIIMFLIYGAISISPWRVQSAGLFTSAAVFAYCTYYLWSALNSEPPGECVGASSGGNKTLNIIAFILTLLSVAYTTWSSSQASDSFKLGGSSSDDEKSRLPYRPDFFYLIFLLASAYLTMIFTGWDLEGSHGQWSVDSGWSSAWVKIAASWVCVLLYTWSLIAHKVLSRRSFY